MIHILTINSTSDHTTEPNQRNLINKIIQVTNKKQLCTTWVQRQQQLMQNAVSTAERAGKR